MEVRIGSLTIRPGKANTYCKRLIGLIGCKEPKAVIIYPCRWVHTWFMQYPVDVVFFDREGNALKEIAGLKPFSATSLVKGAYYVLELPGGTLDRAGSQVMLMSRIGVEKGEKQI